MPTVLFTFGRMNPPTKGHEKLIQHMIREANAIGANAVIGTSETQNSEKNPLSPQNKLAVLRKMFPGVNAISGRTIGNVMKALGNRGYTNLRLVVGENRARNFGFVTKAPSLARSSNNVSATKARKAARNGKSEEGKPFPYYMSNMLSQNNLNAIIRQIKSAPPSQTRPVSRKRTRTSSSKKN